MVTAGLATFVTVGSVLSERDATVEVLVLAADAAPGLDSMNLEVATVDVPTDAPFLDMMMRPGDLDVGLALAHAAEAGHPLLRSDLVASGGTGLSRTVTVPVDSVLIDGLGLVVGDRVDVIGVDAEDVTRFVLNDVRVARLPTSVGADGLLAGPSESFVTLEVDDGQALALVSAQRSGPVELVRSTGAPAASSAPDVSTEEQ